MPYVIIYAMNVVSLAVIRLFLITFLGFYLYKKKSIKKEVLDFLTSFVINFTIPSLIFSHLIENFLPGQRLSLGFFILLSILIFFMGFLLAFIFSFKRKNKFRGEFISLVSFQNGGYLPINLAFFLFSASQREEFLNYIFLYILGYNVIMWSVGSFFIFKKKGESFKFKSIFTSPVISTVLALSFVYTNTARFVPSLILVPIKMIGDTSFVLSMIILGCWLAQISLSGLYKRLFIIGGASFLKLMALPCIFLLVVVKLKIFSLLGLFIILQAAMPSAVSLPIIASLRKADSEFVSQGVLLTHLLSIFTIPLWLGLYLKFSGFTLLESFGL